MPQELVTTLGWFDWQTPINGPFPAFSAERLPQIVQWLTDHGHTALVIDEPT